MNLSRPPTRFTRRRLLYVFILAVAWGGLARGEETEPLPPAAELLRGVHEALPDTPLHITGQLQSKSAAGDIELVRHIEMSLDWSAKLPTARYTIMDAFGTELERLDIARPTRGETQFSYFRAGETESSELPDLLAPIEGMDFSWSDLSLSFLWWPAGKTVGAEKRRGRFCYIIDVPAPAGGAGDYAGVRLWIDPEIKVLLQAEAYNAKGDRLRRLQVKSFKRVNELWTILNLEIQSLPSRHKTVLRVRDVDVEESP